MKNSRGNAIVWIIVFVILVFSFGPIVRDKYRQEKLRQSGIQATATVIRVTDTGSRFNSNPILELQLKVQRSSSIEKTYTLRSVVPVLELERYKIGNQIQVRMNPDDIDDIAIDSEAQQK